MAEYEGIPGFDVEGRVDEAGGAGARAPEEGDAPMEEGKVEVTIADDVMIYLVSKVIPE